MYSLIAYRYLSTRVIPQVTTLQVYEVEKNLIAVPNIVYTIIIILFVYELKCGLEDKSVAVGATKSKIY